MKDFFRSINQNSEGNAVSKYMCTSHMCQNTIDYITFSFKVDTSHPFMYILRVGLCLLTLDMPSVEVHNRYSIGIQYCKKIKEM
jgi:hypothetical protein